MDAAIVEFDTLADAVGPAAENDDLAAFAGLGLAFRRCAVITVFVGGVHVRGAGLEFGGAGIDPLEHRPHVEACPQRGNHIFPDAGQLGQSGVGEAHSLEPQQARGIVGQAVLAELGLDRDQGLDLGQEPGVEARRGGDFLQAHADAEGVGGDQHPVRRTARQLGPQGRQITAILIARNLDFVEPGQAGLQGT